MGLYKIILLVLAAGLVEAARPMSGQPLVFLNLNGVIIVEMLAAAISLIRCTMRRTLVPVKAKALLKRFNP